MIELGPTLAVTLSPLLHAGDGGVQRALELARDAGFRGVQISAAQKGLRPRELDRRARRELLAMIARRGLMLSGVDLMIPHRDFLDAATQDRAAGACISAIALASDLGRVPLSLSLPIDRLPADVAEALVAASDGKGVPLAIHAEHDLDALRSFLDRYDQPLLRAALDPAAIIAQGGEPSEAALNLAQRHCVARLDDHATTSLSAAGGRCIPGDGELDITAYRASLATAAKLRSIVLDLRDLPHPLHAARIALQRWERSATI